ncbi:MAG TPA: 2Fe-2S iron-sulfur cluster-binding protein, partial [Lamprocystis sp. (in: g-proteobacteria)]|nr:2Fe-2S iron-sulfur cluster-binding protein [Lamprocystis sp. (in: g-proteobacteria)]
MKISVYRFNPDTDTKPRMQDYEVRPFQGMMLRDALLEIKKQDESFAFRHSCGEGVCGSDGVNVNGKNCLACITPITDLKEPISIRPFPGRPVIRDLVVDMTQFYEQYRAVKPYLVRTDPL